MTGTQNIVTVLWPSVESVVGQYCPELLTALEGRLSIKDEACLGNKVKHPMSSFYTTDHGTAF